MANKYLRQITLNNGNTTGVVFDFIASADLPAGVGTVTSVGLSLPSIFTVTVSPVTTTGTLTAVLATQSANTVFAGPTSGGAAGPTFRALVAADLPSLATVAVTSFNTRQGAVTLISADVTGALGYTDIARTGVNNTFDAGTTQTFDLANASIFSASDRMNSTVYGTQAGPTDNWTCSDTVTTAGTPVRPFSSDDASAPDNSIYYSTDAGKLVYKDSGGTVNNLH